MDVHPFCTASRESRRGVARQTGLAWCNLWNPQHSNCVTKRIQYSVAGCHLTLYNGSPSQRRVLLSRRPMHIYMPTPQAISPQRHLQFATEAHQSDPSDPCCLSLTTLPLTEYRCRATAAEKPSLKRFMGRSVIYTRPHRPGYQKEPLPAHPVLSPMQISSSLLHHPRDPRGKGRCPAGIKTQDGQTIRRTEPNVQSSQAPIVLPRRQTTGT